MKITVNIKNKAVEIELTAEQIEVINKASEEVTEKIKTFEDALEVVGSYENLRLLLNYNGQESDVVASVAFAKLSIITKALNEGWYPNWEDNKEYKYYPWFKYTVGSAPGFSFSDCGYGRSYTAVGSRLVFKSPELAKYAGQQFIELYNNLL